MLFWHLEDINTFKWLWWDDVVDFLYFIISWYYGKDMYFTPINFVVIPLLFCNYSFKTETEFHYSIGTILFHLEQRSYGIFTVKEELEFLKWLSSAFVLLSLWKVAIQWYSSLVFCPAWIIMSVCTQGWWGWVAWLEVLLRLSYIFLKWWDKCIFIA